jgi:FKBP-type peptidyl-prolyl cis-trans isomerase SlyD
MSDAVADGLIVLFHYTLTDGEGELIDTSRDHGEPMPYLHGAGNIVPGLERQMLGKKVGDTFVAIVPPAEGYGVATGARQTVPRAAFPADAQLEMGMQFMSRDDKEQLVPLWIADLAGDTVTITMDHPLSGVTLNFNVEITRIREPSEEEIAHGHPHGPDGTEGHGQHHDH